MAISPPLLLIEYFGAGFSVELFFAGDVLVVLLSSVFATVEGYFDLFLSAEIQEIMSKPIAVSASTKPFLHIGYVSSKIRKG